MNDYDGPTKTREYEPEPGPRSDRQRAHACRHDQLLKGLAVLDESISALLDELHPVLRPSIPQPDLSDEGKRAAVAPPEMGSELQEQHEVYQRSLQRLISRVQDITGRVDL